MGENASGVQTSAFDSYCDGELNSARHPGAAPTQNELYNQNSLIPFAEHKTAQRHLGYFRKLGNDFDIKMA